LAIVGENFETVRKQIELRWTGNWTEDEDEMLTKEAVIRLQEEADDHCT
jgi:hypothetical protein